MALRLNARLAKTGPDGGRTAAMAPLLPTCSMQRVKGEAAAILSQDGDSRIHMYVHMHVYLCMYI
jgi:hypothetical protein